MLKIERLTAVLDRRGVKKSKHHNDIAEGTWTRGVKLGPRAVGWPSNETDLLIAARIAGATDGEIRQLVERLHAERKSIAPSI